MAGNKERKPQKQRRRFLPSLSLGTKTVLGVAFLTLILSGVSLYVGAYIHRRMEVQEHMSDTWKTASTTGVLLDSMEVGKYMEHILKIYNEKGGREIGEEINEQLDRMFEVIDMEEPDEEALAEIRALFEEKNAAFQALFSEAFTEEVGEIEKRLSEVAEKNNISSIAVMALNPEDNSLIQVFDSSRYNPDSDEEISFLVGQAISLDNYANLQSYYDSGSEGQYSVSYLEDSVNGLVFSSIAPYRDPETGEVIAYIDAFENWDGASRDQKQYVLNYLLGIALIASVLAVLALVITRMSIVRPIRKLSKAAIAYGKQKDKQDGNYFSNLRIHTGDEIQTLGDAMEQLEGDLNQYMRELTSVTAEKERVGAELQMATRIQLSMLPPSASAFPDREDFTISAGMYPAREVGGDFYDFFLLDDSHLVLLIADVSDKGVPAALFMMATKILINYCAKLGGKPSRILESVNKEICSSHSYGRTKMFVTVWLGILDLATGVLTCSNAGHEFPALRRGSGVFEIFKDHHNFVVGGLKSAKYTDYEIQLESGDAIFVYTDGVPEANNDKKEFYGMERMEAALKRLSDRSPKDILEGMKADIDVFANGAEQFDDMTMLCMEWKGRK